MTRFGCAVAFVLLTAAGCSSPPPPSPSPAVHHLVYAAQDDGTVHVYDIDAGHRPVRTIPVFGCCADVRGAAAASPTGRLFVFYNRSGEGHVASVDIVSGRVGWDRVVHAPGVDRGNVTPDGETLYVPTWEDDPSSSYELVIDARTGDERGRVVLPPRSHDTIVSADGTRVFMETKSPTGTMYVASTATNTVVATVPGYCCGGVLAPFSVNGRGTVMVNQLVGFAGFQVADLAAGRVTATVPFASGSAGHGIAFSPDEREVWVNDGAAPLVHVFDMTAEQPREVAAAPVSNPGPHWVTFDIAGRYAYVAGRKGSGDRTDVVEARTRAVVATLSPSEDLFEVDLRGDEVVAVGNQFGVGRVP